MKAAIINGKGQTPVYGEIEAPQTAEGMVKVHVKASALSHLSKIRSQGNHYSSDTVYPKKILQKLFDCLNEDGKLTIIDFDKNDQVNHPKVHNGFSHEALRKLLFEAGFKSAEIRTFHYGERLFMNQDASVFIASGLK